MQDNPEDRDAEARVNAVRGLVSVCETLTERTNLSFFASGETSSSLLLFIKNEVMQSLFKALEDYSVDNRGDVGSWVREAAIIGLEKCTYILCQRSLLNFGRESLGTQSSELDMVETTEEQYFDETLATNLVGGLVKQAVEKMDKLRELSAKVIQGLLYTKTVYVPFIAFREKLEKLIPKDADSEWAVSQDKSLLHFSIKFMLLFDEVSFVVVDRNLLSHILVLLSYFSLLVIANT